MKRTTCVVVVAGLACLLAAAIFPVAQAGAQSITLGPSTPVEGGNYDGWSSNENTEAGTFASGGTLNGTYSYSFTNTGTTNLVFTPQDFDFFSAKNAGNIVTPYIVQVLNTNLNAVNSQQVVSIGATQTNAGTGLQTAAYGGNSFALAPGQEIAIGFLDATASGTGNTGSVVSFFNTGAPTGGDWYAGNGAANTYINAYGQSEAPGTVGNVIGGASAATNTRTYQYNISFNYAVGGQGAWTGLGGATLDNTTNNFALNAGTAALSQGALTAVQQPAFPNVVFGDTYSVSGTATPVSQTNLTVAAGGISPSVPIVFANNSVNYTINSSDAIGISGSTSVTLSGSGMVTFTGAHTYTGNTVINAGTLQLGNGSLDASLTTNSIMNNSALVFDVKSSQTAAYPISGAGTITKNGPGTLTMSVPSTYAGTTTINSGTLKLQGPASVAVNGFGPLGDGTGWTVNTTAVTTAPFTSNVLTLVDGANGEARTAFLNVPVPVNGAFNASFTYQAASASADGGTFMLQNSPFGLGALGGT
ncbi:MAG: autotransporter-associated beta strand repeat-containing protein, partial [Thermoguttaceae bacterium]